MTGTRGPRWFWAIPLLLYLTVVFVNAETAARIRAPLDAFLLILAALPAAW